MVKLDTKNEKLIIEVETFSPIATLHSYQVAIMRALQHIDGESMSFTDNNCPVNTLAELLEQMTISETEQCKAFGPGK